MLKNKFGTLVLVLGMASCVYSCSSEDKTTASATGGSGGGALATGGSAAGGAPATGTGGSAGGASGTGGAGGASTMTLAQACKKNCGLASGLDTCSTTVTVCEQSCLTTFDNTSNVNPDLGRQYTEMMVCIATDPKFATPAGYVCAKPDRALNKWSPGPDSTCEQLICDWNCTDGTPGNFDPFLNIRCACSSV